MAQKAAKTVTAPEAFSLQDHPLAAPDAQWFPRLGRATLWTEVGRTGAHRMKSCVCLVALCLLGLTACTETEWVKPGATDAQLAADAEDCAETARQQAIRDRSPFRTHFGYVRRDDRRIAGRRYIPPSLSELEFRYRYNCMISKGYELVPLDEEPSG